MKRSLGQMVLLSAIALGWNLVAGPAEAGLKFATVTISAVDPAAGTLAVQMRDATEDTVLKIDQSTKVLVGREPAALSDLEPGQKISIMYRSESGNVSRIRIMEKRSSAPRQMKEEKEEEKAPAKSPGAPTPTASSDAKEPKDSDAPDSSTETAEGAEPSQGPWPQWRGPRQDGISTETGLLNPWPRRGLEEVWSCEIGIGYSSFAVVGKRLYTMDLKGIKEYVRCLDAETGKEIWAHGYQGANANSFSNSSNGPRATPTVCGSWVYSIGAAGMLTILDAETGRSVTPASNLLSTVRAQNLPWGMAGSPIVYADMVYANPGGSRGSSIIAIANNTGSTIWRCLDDKAGYATPLLITVRGFDTGVEGDRVLVFFTGQALVGVTSMRGDELFRYPWKTRFDCNIATPIYVDGHLFISSGYDSGCALLKLTPSGEKLSVKEVYRSRDMNNHFSTCIYHDGYLYGFNNDFLTCIDFKTGKKQWTKRGYGKGSLTMADGNLIILSEKGKLSLARPDPEDYEEISSFQALKGRCWTVPVVANGRLYVRNEELLKCFSLR